MSMSLSAREKASAEINVTPLIDVLLVLLIIFMVILPHRQRGEAAEIPIPDPNPTPISRPDNPIVVQLLNSGPGAIPSLRINQDSVEWDTLYTRLTEIFQKRAQKVAFLKSDPEIDFQYVADALDVMHQAGADRIGMMDADSSVTKDAKAGSVRR